MSEKVEKSLRVPEEYVDHLMNQVVYETARVGESTTTVAMAFLNGFSVSEGKSACLDPNNFDEELGSQYAVESAAAKAKDKIWELEGYALLKLHSIQINVAKTAHEVNRAYCSSIGDDSQPGWDDAPEWQKSSALNGVMNLMENPATTPEQSHESWMVEKIQDGWMYGEEKDPEKKTHPCIRPYEELPKEHQVKDHLFIAVVTSLLPAFDPYR